MEHKLEKQDNVFVLVNEWLQHKMSYFDILDEQIRVTRDLEYFGFLTLNDIR